MSATPSFDFMRRLAAAAAAETMPRFRAGGDVVNKHASGFDPVTEADRAAEQAIRSLIAADFPDHGIIGEEFGAEGAERSHVWVIDPIDGTRAFISGLPLWGTLVGLTVDGAAVAGMMSQPFTGELYYADGDGARYEGPGGPRRLATRG
ncbi:inositol monophosphatase family protein, partial [Nitratireductor sp. GCM10026969]|uniref:inositol monophosphatase family protein n=1 Tax=Nitratireductor sp. GCM10026969 TaxID=3252645 RepID=UPI00360B2882